MGLLWGPAGVIAREEVDKHMGIQVNASVKSGYHVGRMAVKLIQSVILHIVVIVLSLAFALPLLWMISSSLKPAWAISQVPPQWIPNPVRWTNYPDALTEIKYTKYLLNTLRIAIPSTIGVVISSALTGYGFSRLRWPGRDALFFILICTMILPGAVVMVPTFVIFRKLGWIGTIKPLVVPAFLGNAFNIFLVRQFMMTVPEEMSEAARIDGANELQIFLHLVLPLSGPVLAVVALFHFIWSWSDYLGPLIYLRDSDLYTLAIGLTSFLGGHMERWELLMAASVVTVAPIIILFFLTQRTFIEGITLTGQKG
jgi:multiple sugar transport system permease protein